MLRLERAGGHMSADPCAMPEENQPQLWPLRAAWQAGFTILGHAYMFNNKLSSSSPAFSFLSLPNPAGLHPR